MKGPKVNRLTAHGRLLAAIASVVDGGQSVPCLGVDAPWWTSEDTEAQAAAATRCQTCPALAVCGAYAAAWPETGGVWAGSTERDRDGRCGPRARRTEVA